MPVTRESWGWEGERENVDIKEDFRNDRLW
jgi:hypothetical protein